MKVIYANGAVAECAPEEELHILRHSAAHILAQAVKNLCMVVDVVDDEGCCKYSVFKLKGSKLDDDERLIG